MTSPAVTRAYCGSCHAMETLLAGLSSIFQAWGPCLVFLNERGSGFVSSKYPPATAFYTLTYTLHITLLSIFILLPLQDIEHFHPILAFWDFLWQHCTSLSGSSQSDSTVDRNLQWNNIFDFVVWISTIWLTLNILRLTSILISNISFIWKTKSCHPLTHSSNASHSLNGLGQAWGRSSWSSSEAAAWDTCLPLSECLGLSPDPAVYSRFLLMWYPGR